MYFSKKYSTCTCSQSTVQVQTCTCTFQKFKYNPWNCACTFFNFSRSLHLAWRRQLKWSHLQSDWRKFEFWKNKIFFRYEWFSSAKIVKNTIAPTKSTCTSQIQVQNKYIYFYVLFRKSTVHVLFQKSSPNPCTCKKVQVQVITL